MTVARNYNGWYTEWFVFDSKGNLVLRTDTYAKVEKFFALHKVGAFGAS